MSTLSFCNLEQDGFTLVAKTSSCDYKSSFTLTATYKHSQMQHGQFLSQFPL